MEPYLKCQRSSSPGESHPQALHRSGLESLDSSGSSCPPTLVGFALLSGSSHFWLTNKQFWTCYPLRSTSITETSSLLRGNPPPCLASVLSFLWGLHLNFSLDIETTGSHVPPKSLYRDHATFMPGAAQTVDRYPLCLSRDQV